VTPEGKVKKKVKEVLTNLGAYYVMPNTGGYGSSGAPDFLVCFQGHFIGIECKAGDNSLTALQLHHGMYIGEAGGRWIMVNESNLIELECMLAGIYLPILGARLNE